MTAAPLQGEARNADLGPHEAVEVSAPIAPGGSHMSRRPSRPRRSVSKPTIKLLRAAGWRYSATREAYVHRLGDGRIGPVFCEHAPEVEEHSLPDTRLYEAMVAVRKPRIVPEHEREPLPRRGEEPRVTTVVEVALAAEEPPRLVVVDGRPPRRGIDPRVLKTPGVVTSIKSRRATA